MSKVSCVTSRRTATAVIVAAAACVAQLMGHDSRWLLPTLFSVVSGDIY